MKFRMRHKEEGWTGTLEVVDGRPTAEASHVIHYQLDCVIIQDETHPDGHYVEDPRLSLDDLELLEKIA
jgi:hypothetical protein